MNGYSLFPSRIRFRGALLIYVVAPLICAMGFFGYLTLNTIEKQVETQMQTDLELVARSVQLPLSYALEKHRMGSMMQALESVFSIGRVYSAYIYDEEGKEIAVLGVADPAPQRERLTELAAEGRSRGEYGSIAGRNVYSYFVPLTDTGGRIKGLLQLTRRGREFNEDIRPIRVKGVLSLGVLLGVLSGLVLYGHHRALGMHLGRLNASMSRIANGERDHRFNHRGPKEILELGESFNHMLNSMEQAEREIVKHRLSQEELENRLRQSEKMAALGRLAAGTAHELGTPLSVVSGKAQRALRQEGIPEVQRATLVDIRKEVVRMEYIIKQLLDFSRQGPFRCSPADPASIAASAVAAIEEENRAGGTAIELCGPENVRPVIMDTLRVHQALINLLRNAVQCSADGNIRVSWEQCDDGVCFSVEDDGPGVPREKRARIFEPFFTDRSVGQGTGLGLAVVHSVAEEHGGWVDVSDSEMGGACFRLTVPGRSREG